MKKISELIIPSLALVLYGLGFQLAQADSNSTPTITRQGEVNASANQKGVDETYCASFKLGVTGHHDVNILSQTLENPPTGLLKNCGDVAQKLEDALKNNTYTSISGSGVPQVFRENYYYERNYSSIITLNNNILPYSFYHDSNNNGDGNNWKYDRNYYDYYFNNYPNNQGGGAAITSFCRAQVDPSTNKLLAFEVRYRPLFTDGSACSAQNHDNCSQTVDKCAVMPVNYSCNMKDVYQYTFKHEINQNGNFVTADSTVSHKCENVKLSFSADSEWFQSLAATDDNINAINSIVPISHDMWISPPANLLTCADQSTCLAAATEFDLGNDTWGKGAHQIPTNFVDNVQKSLTGKDGSKVSCADGICVSYASGNQELDSTVAATAFYGQCRNNNVTIAPAKADIPQIINNSLIDFVNRPPSTSVSLSSNNIQAGDEVTATCNAQDPDTCIDKISKIRWYCADSAGSPTKCYFTDVNGQTWSEGELIQDIPTAQRANPYAAQAKYKFTGAGPYNVYCEAWDDDNNNQLKGGVVAAGAKYCAVLPSGGTDKAACSLPAKVTYETYQSGLDVDGYQWRCDSNEDYKTGGNNYDCTYGNSGQYNPGLKMHDKTTNSWVDCTTLEKTNVEGSGGSCQVLVSATHNNYVIKPQSQITVDTDTQVKATVKQNCLDSGTVNWTIVNGTKLSSDNNALTAKFPQAGTGKIQASVTKNGNTVTCSEAILDVKDQVNWGM